EGFACGEVGECGPGLAGFFAEVAVHVAGRFFASDQAAMSLAEFVAVIDAEALLGLVDGHGCSFAWRSLEALPGNGRGAGGFLGVLLRLNCWRGGGWSVGVHLSRA